MVAWVLVMTQQRCKTLGSLVHARLNLSESARVPCISELRCVVLSDWRHIYRARVCPLHCKQQYSASSGP